MVVYLVTNLSNGKHYVGKTVLMLEKRWALHLSKARSGSGWYLHAAIRRHGPDAFTIIPLVSILATDPQLKEQERFWIRLFNANDPRYGYNLTAGGDGRPDYKCSEETRRKISEARKSKLGHRHSVETRLKMSAAKMGHPVVEETRRKLRAANTGRKCTPEQSEARRMAHFLKTVAWG